MQPSGFQFHGEVILEGKFSAGLRTCLAGRLETFSFIPFFPLCNLWQGEMEPARKSLELLRAQQSRPWRSWGSQLVSPTSAPDSGSPGCVPAMAPSHRGFPSPKSKHSGCSLSPSASLATCVVLPSASPSHSTLPVGKLPQVLEVQVALELLSGCCQPWVLTSSPCPALGEHLGLLQLLWLRLEDSCTRAQK